MTDFEQDGAKEPAWKKRLKELGEKASSLAKQASEKAEQVLQSRDTNKNETSAQPPASNDHGSQPLDPDRFTDRLQQKLSKLAEKAEKAADFVQMPARKGFDQTDHVVNSAKWAGKEFSSVWSSITPKYLPFADAASEGLPLNRLLRLSLFQISVGMAMVLLTGTLNRVMYTELHIPAFAIALMVALPILFAPFRAFIGFKSDHRKSFIGWKRVPFIWLGTISQFLGLALMPFALFLMSGDGASGSQMATTVAEVAERSRPFYHYVFGYFGTAVAFLLVGLGFHTTQTAGLSLATDLAEEDKRPRVIALMYVMLLLGMIFASLFYGYMLAPSAPDEPFSNTLLVQTIQITAVLTIVLNIIALWKQEPRDPSKTRHDVPEPAFKEAWASFSELPNLKRLLLVIFLGTAGFSMQDILLEPYGGEMLGLSVSATTLLTAFFAFGSLIGFAVSAKGLEKGVDPCRLSTAGLIIGIPAFALILLSNPMDSTLLYRVGSVLIGFGGGLYAVGTLTAIMSFADRTDIGLTLGAWGAVQATAMGGATVLGGFLKSIFSGFFSLFYPYVAVSGMENAVGLSPEASYIGYAVVYLLEIALLVATLVVIWPLARKGLGVTLKPGGRFEISGLPG